MFKNRYIAVAAAAAAVGGAGISAAAVVADAATVHPATAHPASAAALKLASVSVSGTKHSLLENSAGRAVYLVTGDSVTHAKCKTAACLAVWPPVTSTATKPVLGSGIKGKLTVWSHGKVHQLVLNGHPLYTFAEDKSANSAKGQGVKNFGGTWELLTSSGTAYTGTAKSTSSTTTTSPSGSWS